MNTKTIKINAKTPYDVIVGQGLLSNLADFLPKELQNDKKAAIITDSNVATLYEQTARTSLETAGFKVITHVFESGEEHKTLDELSAILNFLADNHMTRSDFIIALGGGIVGDMAGFAAGVYLRGIKYVQVPTTFLAAVDSSVGGKTAVNLNAGKNLAGLFFQPLAVICDADTFKTLDDKTFCDGVSEAVKHGFILDENFFAKLKGKTRAEYMEDIVEIVARNVEIKGQIVGADEFEHGQRQILNFGHTAAHAIEKCTAHKVSHGGAVAIGMVIMSRAAYKKGFCERDYSGEIEQAFAGFANSVDMNICENITAEEMYNAALSDKKRSGGKINIIIPKCVGNCVIKQIGAEELLEIFRIGMNHT